MTIRNGAENVRKWSNCWNRLAALLLHWTMVRTISIDTKRDRLILWPLDLIFFTTKYLTGILQKLLQRTEVLSWRMIYCTNEKEACKIRFYLARHEQSDFSVTNARSPFVIAQVSKATSLYKRVIVSGSRARNAVSLLDQMRVSPNSLPDNSPTRMLCAQSTSSRS